MVTPEVIYSLPAEKIGPLSNLISTEHTFIPEVGGWRQDIRDVQSERVRVAIIKEVALDSRRIWRLSTVWLDNQPVMILQNAGREGDDHYSRLITDLDRYQKMIAHLGDLMPGLPPAPMDVDGIVDEITDLTRFYNRSFDVETGLLTE